MIVRVAQRRLLVLLTEGSEDVDLISSVSWSISFSRDSLSRWVENMFVEEGRYE